MRRSDHGALRIETDGDTLTVRAKNGITRWLGALFVAAGLGLMIAAANPHTVSRIWLVLFCAVFLLGCGIFLLLPQVYTTIFDSRSRQIVYSIRTWNRPPKIERYAFEDIAGIALNKDFGIGHCAPYLELKKPQNRLLLSPQNGIVSVTAGVNLMEAICAATGLPVLDLESW
ncbi:hypothetical protein QEV83_08560 [Methylocapsa sp. D3K7]|uniref:hypothetical protein n=1 Tax=Methylocapsa sp. D3K7 TaxID=3041435 RepID=UPI00244EAD1B|nr:hypothetical protein [Methylocapsa sp. D3K7]WGJ16275.1 hypothetical protein QEV83_08560 [Methylocapsa sp. D3K7]